MYLRDRPGDLVLRAAKNGTTLFEETDESFTLQ